MIPSTAVDRLPLFVVTDDAYCFPACVALTSAARTMAPNSCTAHLVCVDVGFEGRRMIERMAGLNPNLDVRVARFSASRLKGLPSFADERISAAGYVRLFLDELEASCETRLLYLDADTLVMCDPSQLARLDLEGAPVGAVRDPYVWNTAHVGRYISLAPTSEQRAMFPYFNSGVMLIDVHEWTAREVGAKCLSLLTECGDFFEYGDQDALNIVLADQWRAMPVKWNVFSSPDHRGLSELWPQALYERARQDPGIVHYTGPAKPWIEGSAAEFSSVYRRAASALHTGS